LISVVYVTDGNNDDLLKESCQRITSLNCPGLEIIIVGKTAVKGEIIRHIEFDESQKRNWITRKKNLGVQASQNRLVLILHDYIALDKGWNTKSIQKLSEQDFDVASCAIVNQDGTRFRDWSLWTFNHVLLKPYFSITLRHLLPYSESRLTDLMYLNGSAFFVDKGFFEEHPLDENRTWGEAEDVEWSTRLSYIWKLVFLKEVSLKCLKAKTTAFRPLRHWERALLRAYMGIFRLLPKSIQQRLLIPL
jgi:hypothetical protein